MSTYGPLNGLWTSSHYDLLTNVLREEWGFDGVVMTDWWAKGNEEGEMGSIKNTSAMVRSQNDVYMVTASAKENSNDDNSEEGLKMGKVTRGEFQRSAMNICKALMKLPAFLRMRGIETDLDKQLKECITEEDEAILELEKIQMDGNTSLDVSLIHTERGRNSAFQIFVNKKGTYRISITCRANTQSTLAQIPLTIYQNQYLERTITLSGADTEWRTEHIEVGPIMKESFYLRFYFGQSGMEIKECNITFVKPL